MLWPVCYFGEWIYFCQYMEQVLINGLVWLTLLCVAGMTADGMLTRQAGNTSVPSYSSAVQDHAVEEDWDAG